MMTRSDLQKLSTEDLIGIIALRTEAGAAFLDAVHGPGWESKVDLDRLDLSSPRSCTLAQVYGMAYIKAAAKVKLTHTYDVKDPRMIDPATGAALPSAIVYGFTDEEDMALILNKRDIIYYNVLTEAWRNELRRRLNVPAEAVALAS